MSVSGVGGGAEAEAEAEAEEGVEVGEEDEVVAEVDITKNIKIECRVYVMNSKGMGAAIAKIASLLLATGKRANRVNGHLESATCLKGQGRAPTTKIADINTREMIQIERSINVLPVGEEDIEDITVDINPEINDFLQ